MLRQQQHTVIPRVRVCVCVEGAQQTPSLAVVDLCSHSPAVSSVNGDLHTTAVLVGRLVGWVCWSGAPALPTCESGLSCARFCPLSVHAAICLMLKLLNALNVGNTLLFAGGAGLGVELCACVCMCATHGGYSVHTLCVFVYMLCTMCGLWRPLVCVHVRECVCD